MKADNIKNLLLGILIVLFLLSICVTVDYADDTITVTENQTVDKNINSSGIIVLNDTYYAGEKEGVAKIQSVVTEKHKLPMITMTGKPSCSRCARNHIPYKWFTRSYVNYCPNCNHYKTLGNKHKWGSRYENEITCFRCDSDFCIYDGHEKYSCSKKYLRRV